MAGEGMDLVQFPPGEDPILNLLKAAGLSGVAVGIGTAEAGPPATSTIGDFFRWVGCPIFTDCPPDWPRNWISGGVKSAGQVVGSSLMSALWPLILVGVIFIAGLILIRR